MTADSPFSGPSEKHARAIGLVSETMGELVEFWGFKASMGRIWACLYLSSQPLTATCKGPSRPFTRSRCTFLAIV